MAGFMSPSLGFSSTIGAAIGGAARQANELYAEDRQHAAQDDILNQVYMNKFDNATNDWQKQKLQYQKDASLLDTFTKLAGGNKEVAFTYFNLARHEKNPDMGAIAAAIQKDAAKAGPSDPNYRSPFEDEQQQALNAAQQRAENIYGRLNPKNQQRVGGMPSFDTTPNIGPQPPQNQSTSNIGTQLPQSQPTPAQPQATPNVAPQVAQGQQAAGVVNNLNNPDLDQQIGASAPAGEPIPLDNLTTPQNNAPQITPAANTVPNTAAQATPAAAINFPSVKGAETQRQQNQDKLERDKYQLAQDEFAWKKSQKTASPEDAAELELKKQDTIKYLHDPKTGLQARYADLNSTLSQSQDLNSIQTILERGFKANAVQPAYDELNRFTTATLGLDLGTAVGPANNYTDVNTFRKAVANAVIDRLKTLHFGRITNYEAGLVQSGFTSQKNDPITNMKIILMLKSSVQSAMQQTQAEYDTMYGANAPKGYTWDKAASARQVGQQIGNEYLKKGVPWQQVNGHSQDASAQFAKIPGGTWFEDTGSQGGVMYYKTQNGKLLRAGDNINE